MKSKTLLVEGGTPDYRKTVTTIAQNVLKNNFTAPERHDIGSVVINLGGRGLSSSLAADTGRVPLPPGMTNPGRRGATEIRLGAGVRNIEQSITHECVHAMYRGSGRQRTNEKRIDFEVMSRLTREGVRTSRTGYYYGDTTKFPRGTSMDRKVRFVKGQIAQDRRTLTGSMNRSIQGREAQNRADRLYSQSMFARRPRFR